MRMTHDEMIAVIQAQKKGKPREARRICALNNSEWFPISPNENCNFHEWEYRIAPPAPREGWVCSDLLYQYPGRALGDWIHVREIAEREGT